MASGDRPSAVAYGLGAASSPGSSRLPHCSLYASAMKAFTWVPLLNAMSSMIAFSERSKLLTGLALPRSPYQARQSVASETKPRNSRA